MDLPLSPRIRATGAPPIPSVRGWAARYQGGAGPVLDLTQAVPGYPPHPELLARLAAAAGERRKCAACCGGALLVVWVIQQTRRASTRERV